MAAKQNLFLIVYLTIVSEFNTIPHVQRFDKIN